MTSLFDDCMNYEAILFDMDGVIIDTKESVLRFWNSISIKLHGKKLTIQNLNEHVYGCTANYSLDMLFSDLNEKQRDHILSQLELYETKLKYKEVKGVTLLLRELKKYDFPTALVTSGKKWKISQAFLQLGIEGLFTIEVTADEIRESKPNPECYSLAANLLGKSSSRCLVFEDAVVGVKAAVTSGAKCIGVKSSTTSKELMQAGAKYVISNFKSVKLISGPHEGKNSLALDIGSNKALQLI